MKAKKEIDSEFSKEFKVLAGFVKSIMAFKPAEIESLKGLILSMRGNIKDMRKRGFITREHAQCVFDEFLKSLDIYERRDLLLGLFLDPLRVQKRPFKKDLISTIIWRFGFCLENYYNGVQKTDPEYYFPEIAELVSRPGGYWGAMGELFAEAGIDKAYGEPYTAQELKKQYDRLKNTKFRVICKDRYLTYLNVSLAFGESLPVRRSELAAELSKLFPL